MTYNELFDRMKESGMISADWRHVIALVKNEIASSEGYDDCMKLFILYFSLIDDGNVYMPLDEGLLGGKIERKIEGLKNRLKESEKESGKESVLDTISEELRQSFKGLSALSSLSVTGSKKLFVTENGRLFTRKYYNAKRSIADSAERLFKNRGISTAAFNYKDACDGGFGLTKGQEEVLKKGLDNNLLVTGGPGTGKTTSILFILLALLEKEPDRQIYMTAPSGKAAARMKESVLNSLKNVSEEYKKKHAEIIRKIEGLEDYTIHRLLGIDRDTKGFIYNKNKRFPENSVFVIDEASMIDICLFAALLEAIPDGAGVFILGDKNQLPSVECGAVFGEWLQAIGEENKVALNESKRFDNESAIYTLSEAVNNGSILPVTANDWRALGDFRIEEKTFRTERNRENKIYYYNGVESVKSDDLNKVYLKWYGHYFKSMKDACTKVRPDDPGTLDNIFNTVESARILCGDNESVRGAEHVNRIILKNEFKGGSGSASYYPGELLMVTRNNHSIDLYNGDSGVAVTFENDDTVYCVFKKSPEHLLLNEGLVPNRISKIGGYLVYPLRLISSDEIKPAFAITIHKSQGSDYDDILVVLPKLKGHPLVNRQIVYTAITRTKGDTYIVSDQDNLEAAKINVITRDTGIFS